MSTGPRRVHQGRPPRVNEPKVRMSLHEAWDWISVLQLALQLTGKPDRARAAEHLGVALTKINEAIACLKDGEDGMEGEDD